MAQYVRDVMSTDPMTLSSDASIFEAAQAMRDEDIGDVIVCTGDELRGIITDRDIVVRALADGTDPMQTTLGDICSTDVVSVSPSDTIERAVELMRDGALRRLPVVDGGRPVGVVSIGDLAIERDERSALADISAADPNT